MTYLSTYDAMKTIFQYFLLISLIAGCSSIKSSIQKNTRKTFESQFYENQFTGFLVVNSQTQDTLLKVNSKKYFTPASNTKIFTLFTANALLSDSIPALKYLSQNDTLFVQGTGDPTLLHSYFEKGKTIDFLKQHKNIVLYLKNFQGEKFGSGWAWDDYGYYYQPEITPFPIYGNVTTIYNAKTIQVKPYYFKKSVVPVAYKVNRELEKNLFYFNPSRKDTLEIPFKTSPQLLKALLERALDKKIILSETFPTGVKRILHSVPTDTVLKRMMYKSDNFLAEQLLLLSSSTFSDTLSGNQAREYILKNKLSDLKQLPRWVDGSGLSRYNLFTPESMVAVLNKMHKEIPKEKLFDYFPAGGATGTLKDWYKGNPNPYIYAKSGSLGSVYCLSGYLLTKSGKTLIFSFMNNHFRHPSSEVKEQMQQIFEEIRDTY